MSKYLFPVSRIDNKYSHRSIELGIPGAILSNGSCIDDDNNFYMGIQTSQESDNIYYIKKMNMDTGNIVNMHSIHGEKDLSMSKPNMLIDDNNIYYLDNYASDHNALIWKVSRTIYSYRGIQVPQDLVTVESPDNTFETITKMDWVNDSTIVISAPNGLYFLDVNLEIWYAKYSSDQYQSRSYVTVGKSTIMSHTARKDVDDENMKPLLYHMDTGTFELIDLPDKTPQVSVYNNGIYYIAQDKKIHLYSESKGKIIKTITGPSNPSDIAYSNGNLVISQNNNIITFCDLSNSSLMNIELPWNVKMSPDENFTHSLTRMKVNNGTLYIHNSSLEIIDIPSAYRPYKFGSQIKKR